MYTEEMPATPNGKIDRKRLPAAEMRAGNLGEICRAAYADRRDSGRDTSKKC